MLMPVVVFILTTSVSLIMFPVVRWLSFRWGVIAIPRADRWHKKPTPVFGGMSIIIAFLVGMVVSALWSSDQDNTHWIILGGCFMMFFVGMWDDVRPMSPTAKLVGQISAATFVVALGIRTDFFTPRIANPFIAELGNVLLTFIWLVGITNAINLLDNMDGLAGGIAFITALVLAYFFERSAEDMLFLSACSLAGGILGFLVVNFPPAKIFMGDNGSLFLGFSLASLAIARQPQASNVFAVMGVPTILFLLPILDTTFVAFTRVLRGQSPTRGGRDHTSHRLMAFGLSERQTLFILYSVAAVSGILAATLESIQYWFSLVLVPAMLIASALFIAYLGRVKVVPFDQSAESKQGPFTRVLLRLTFQARLLEVILDFLLIGLAYTGAVLLASGFSLGDEQLPVFLSSFPLALTASYISFYVSGVYRGIWRYVGINELIRFLQASFISVVILSASIFLWGLFGELPWGDNYPSTIVIFFFLFLFVGLASTRYSFRLLDVILPRKQVIVGERVLIVGVGDASEMALRWIQANPTFNWHPVGLMSDDEMMIGRQMHGIRVLGDLRNFKQVVSEEEIKGVILAAPELSMEAEEEIARICQECGCWLKKMKLEFEGFNFQL